MSYYPRWRDIRDRKWKELTATNPPPVRLAPPLRSIVELEDENETLRKRVAELESEIALACETRNEAQKQSTLDLERRRVAEEKCKRLEKIATKILDELTEIVEIKT